MTEVQQETIEQIQSIEVNLPGNRLRETREAKRMSREEVANHLHLDVQIITALEQDNYAKLPSPIYVCGYLRSYARLLKLPDAEIVSAYTRGKEINAALIPENVNIMPGKKAFNPAIFKSFFLLLLVIIVAGVLFWVSDEIDWSSAINGSEKIVEMPLSVPQAIESPSDEEQTQSESTPSEDAQALTPPSVQEIEEKIAQQETETTAQLPVTEEQTSNEANRDLRLVFNEDSWTEITDSDGIRHVYQLMKAGSELSVAGKAPFKVLLGKAGGVEVYYKDKQFDHSRFHRDDVAYFRIGIAE